MTYLQALFGGSEAYAGAARRLSAALGFSVSSTGLHHNSEIVGERLAFRPFDLLDAKRQSEHCEVMIVEVDGTTSPQIHQEEGIRGRENLKQPTEYKECNLIAIEKRSGVSASTAGREAATVPGRDSNPMLTRQGFAWGNCKLRR